MHTAIFFLKYAVMSAVVLLVMACTQREPSLVIQVCTQNADDMAQLLDEFRSIATERQMQHIDDSIGQRQDRQRAGIVDPARADGSPEIYIEVRDARGMGFVAFNNGLPGYQVALGFMRGTTRSTADHFAGDVVARLSAQWVVHQLPPGASITPMPDCG